MTIADQDGILTPVPANPLRTPSADMPRTIRNLRWWLIALLMLGGTINFDLNNTTTPGGGADRRPGITTKRTVDRRDFPGRDHDAADCGLRADVVGLKLALRASPSPGR
jgi:hypothetical protein